MTPVMRLSQFDPAIVRSLILAHPGVSPVLRNRIISFPPVRFQQAAQQVENAIGNATGSVPVATPEGTAVVAPFAAAMIATESAWETEGRMDPKSSLRRWRANPTRFLGATTVLSAAGAGTLEFDPQETFDGYKLVVPSLQAALPAQLSNFVVGDQEMITETNNIGSELVSEQSDLGRIDMPRMELGMKAFLDVTEGVASKEIAAVILGYGVAARAKLPEGAELLYTRMEPMGQVALAAGGTGTFKLEPQRNVFLRRLGFGYGATQTGSLGSVYVTNISVQGRPQLEGGIEIPLMLFNILGIDEWIDSDLCLLGGKIEIDLRNADGTNPIDVDGLATVDVVRLAGQPR